MQYVRELHPTYRRIKLTSPAIGTVINGPGAAVPVLKSLLSDAAREKFLVLHLDAHNRIRSFATCGVGDVGNCPVMISGVFQTALLANASGILVGHNHPSGDPNPSVDDRALTFRIQKAGALLDMPLVDHVIIADGRVFSFAEEGILAPRGTAA